MLIANPIKPSQRWEKKQKDFEFHLILRLDSLKCFLQILPLPSSKITTANRQLLTSRISKSLSWKPNMFRPQRYNCISSQWGLRSCNGVIVGFPYLCITSMPCTAGPYWQTLQRMWCDGVMNDLLLHLHTLSNAFPQIFIMSDRVSEKINHILKTAWIIKWAGVAKPGNGNVIYLCECVCARVTASERSVTSLPVPASPCEPGAPHSRHFAESNNFTQLLEEEMNWAASNNKIIQMLLQTRLLLSYFNSNVGTPGSACGTNLPE